MDHSALEAAIFRLGQECVVWLTGDPEDAEAVTTTEFALKAIRRSLEVGVERNNELNALRMVPRTCSECGRVGCCVAATLDPK